MVRGQPSNKRLLIFFFRCLGAGRFSVYPVLLGELAVAQYAFRIPADLTVLGHRHIRPKSILQKDIIDHFGKDYLYLGCIDYINQVRSSLHASIILTSSIRQVKKGPFAEHSPMLYDISGVASWQKINQGMLKMYFAEVLSKLPIVQHFLFGSILPFVIADKDE